MIYNEKNKKALIFLRLKHFLKRDLCGILFLLILFFIFDSLYSFWPSDIRTSKVPSWHGVLQCQSIAISESVYGLKNNIGYRKVYETFYPSLESGDDGVSISKMNEAIYRAINLEKVDEKGVHYLLGTGTSVGMIDFLKISYGLFGYKAESQYYLYTFLFLLPIVIYLLTFYNNINYIIILCLYLISYNIIVSTSVVAFETVIGVRFFPLLTILPIIYLFLIITQNVNLSIKHIFYTSIQAGILLFSFHIRSHSRYHFIVLFLILIFWAAIRCINKYKLNKKIYFALSRLKVWPFYIVIVFFVAWFIYVDFLRPASPTDKESVYPIWHQIFIGLGGHPNALERYGITFSDATGLKYAIKLNASKGINIDYGLAVNEIVQGIYPSSQNFYFTGRKYEELIRSAYFRILLNDPVFVLYSYVHKIPLYFKVLFSNSRTPSFLPDQYGNVDIITKLFNIKVIFSIFLICYFYSTRFINSFYHLKNFYCLLFLDYLFSIIPPIITLPATHSVLDSGLIFTILILLFIVHIGSYLRYKFKIMFFQNYQTIKRKNIRR
jgi:hypothetical protein